MDCLSDPQAWVPLLTLLALEIVLGIDNIIFISILAGKLPAEQQARARYIGLGLALVIRVILLFSLSWVISLTAPLFVVFNQEISGRDLILILGGLFLLGKATFEIHENLEGEVGHASAQVKGSFISVIIQIIILDAVFSLDSVITAVGMVDEIGDHDYRRCGRNRFYDVVCGARRHLCRSTSDDQDAGFKFPSAHWANANR